ncbi:hypothetical protein HanPSC8_Chr17g0763911 [Helianthus annuus]|nr:hypothetical protein HanPSC8_Chr17g0763911 [Helianthus annuus]
MKNDTYTGVQLLMVLPSLEAWSSLPELECENHCHYNWRTYRSFIGDFA